MKSIEVGRLSTTDIKLTLLNDYSLQQGGNMLYGRVQHISKLVSSSSGQCYRDVGPDVEQERSAFWRQAQLRGGFLVEWLSLKVLVVRRCNVVAVGVLDAGGVGGDIIRDY